MEIKFRAWEKDIKQMIPVYNIDFVNKMINTESAWRLFNEIEIMQYTGLKDKNGKEIFEGDILTDHGEEPPLYVEYSIKQGGFCFVDKFDRHGTYYYTAQTISYEQFEVIGNIYENPRLLLEVSE